MGFADRHFPFSSNVGETATSFGCRSNGEVLFNGKVLDNIFRFRRGDTVGCGISFLEKKVFFTKSDHLLGFIDIPVHLESYFFTVSFCGPRASALFNFGSRPFKFDLQKHIQNELQDTLKDISSRVELTQKKALHMICSHLFLNGFKESLDSLIKASKINENDIKVIAKGFFAQEKSKEKSTPNGKSKNGNTKPNGTHPNTTSRPENGSGAANRPEQLLGSSSHPQNRAYVQSYVRRILSSAFFRFNRNPEQPSTESSAHHLVPLSGEERRRASIESAGIEREAPENMSERHGTLPIAEFVNRLHLPSVGRISRTSRKAENLLKVELDQNQRKPINLVLEESKFLERACKSPNEI